ncbi:MAG TPA: serine hydrolase domain-containing protein [Steroidobacteraceae bacterium]|nr:serine hydrolase domain-containing protein [Steroidobacteraceae bacterium]
MRNPTSNDRRRRTTHVGGAALTMALLLLTGGAVACAADAVPDTNALTSADVAAFMDGIVPYAIQSGDIAGATVSVVADGQIIFAKGYGFADMKTRRPVSADRTLFRPGSVSKTFTWTAVMQLVQAGKLDLDRDVNDYLDFKIPEKFGKPITLRNLMTHTPGWEDTIAGAFVQSPKDFIPYRDYLIRHLPAQIFPPGKVVAYSNYGAMLAGYIIQRVSGEPYDEYIARHIFQPLGMTRSTFDQPLPATLAEDMSQGYVKASDDKPVPFEDIEIAPAGSLSSTAVDMAHFMIAQLENGSYAGASIMTPATTQLMHTPTSRMAPGMNGFALGFYQEDRNGLRILAHAGDTTAFHSDMHLLLDKHVGLFISLNSLGKDGAAENVRTGIFRAFLDRYYPYTPPAESTVPHPQADAARVAGWYEVSRRLESAFRIFNGLEQMSVTALPDGEIEVSVLKDLAGVPKHWREVGPLTYREVGGQTHLKFVTDSDGQVAYWISDDFIPVMLFQKVHGLMEKGRLTWMGSVCLTVLGLTLAIWIGGAIVRRRFKTPLLVTFQEKRLRLASRIGVLLMLALVVAWVGVFDLLLNTNGSVNGALTIAYIVGVLGLLGALAVLVEAVSRVMRGPGGWLVRCGEVVLALWALYGLWAIFAFGFASFSFRY